MNDVPCRARKLDSTYTKTLPNFVYSSHTANTNLRVHLEKYHEDEYVLVCQENNWPMQLAKRKIREEALKQTTLDSVVIGMCIDLRNANLIDVTCRCAESAIVFSCVIFAPSD